MKKIIGLSLLLILIPFSSCKPKVSTIIDKKYTPLDTGAEILVIDEKQELPSNAESLGLTSVTDTGASANCGYQVVIKKIKGRSSKNRREYYKNYRT